MPAMKQTADNDESGGEDIIAAQIEIMAADDKETEKDLFLNGNNKVAQITDKKSGMCIQSKT